MYKVAKASSFPYRNNMIPSFTIKNQRKEVAIVSAKRIDGECKITLEMLRASDKIAITRKEAAEALGVDPRTITAAINSGDIPSVKLGSRKVIPRAKFVRLFD